MNKFLAACVGLLVFLSAVQTICWPIIAKPEFIDWWQFYSWAEIGKYVAWPALVIGLLTKSALATWLASLIWSSLVAILVLKILNLLSKKN